MEPLDLISSRPCSRIVAIGATGTRTGPSVVVGGSEGVGAPEEETRGVSVLCRDVLHIRVNVHCVVVVERVLIVNRRCAHAGAAIDHVRIPVARVRERGLLLLLGPLQRGDVSQGPAVARAVAALPVLVLWTREILTRSACKSTGTRAAALAHTRSAITGADAAAFRCVGVGRRTPQLTEPHGGGATRPSVTRWAGVSIMAITRVVSQLAGPVSRANTNVLHEWAVGGGVHEAAVSIVVEHCSVIIRRVGGICGCNAEIRRISVPTIVP